MSQRIPRSVSSYTVLPDSVLNSNAQAKAFVVSQGFDGAVLIRPVATDKETSYVPGTTYAAPARYGSFGGYWGYGWGGAYDPGHYRQDQVIYVETNVYSLADDKLIWSAKTKTYNPDNIPKMINEIIDQSIDEKQKQGIVTKVNPAQRGQSVKLVLTSDMTETPKDVSVVFSVTEIGRPVRNASYRAPAALLACS